MRLVVAIGGNALMRRGEAAEAAIQRARVLEAASALAALAADHELVVTHGNGPQAESQGTIGYLLAQALGSELPGREVVTLSTQVVVDADDPAFAVPSEPRAIVELRSIERLLATGAVVVCAGGEIPVVGGAGRLTGVEAVMDEDLTAALLAEELDADRLILLTDVPYVERDRGTPFARPIELATPDSLRRLVFAAGSMQPKIEAVCRFVERTGRTASIGSLRDAAAVFGCEVGTQVVPRQTAARLRLRRGSAVH